MRCKLTVCTIAVVMILVASTPALADGGPTKIFIGYEPGQPTETVEVLLANGATEARVPLFVTYDAEEPLKSVLFYAGLRDEEDRAVTTGSLQFVDPGQNDAVLGRIDLDPGAGARQVVLRISNFSTFGAFAGFIAVEVDGSSSRVAGLRVERPAEPVLKVQEAGEGTEIILTTFGPRLDDSFFLLETSGQAERQPLTLSVSQLRAAGGRTATVTLDPSSLSLEPYLARRVRIRGTLPEVGEFRGLLTLTYGDRQKTYTLVTKRELGQAQLALEAISPPPMTHVLWFPVTATIRLDLSETAGGQAELYRPSLQKLVQAGTGTDKPEAHYQHWDLRDQAGKAIVREAADGKPAVLTLDPAQPAQMTLVVQGLTGSGQYEGTVQVATPSGVVISDTFTLFVKDHWFFPAVAILLGALGSYALRHWLQIGRPQILEEAAIRRMLNRVVEAIPDAQNAIRQALVAKLSELLEANRLKPDTNVDDELKEIGVMLNNYLLIRDVLALRDRLDQLVPDGEEQEDIRQQLNDIDNTLRRRLLDALRNDEQGNNALVDAAEKLRAKLMEAAEKSISAAITELRAALTQERTWLEDSSLSPAQREGLDKQLGAVEKGISRAEKAIASSRDATGERAIQLAQEAYQAYNQARRRYQAMSIDRFRLTLQAQKEPPLGFEEAEWVKLRQMLLDMLPADASAEAYESARKTYLAAVLKALRNKAQENAETVKKIVDVKDKAGLFTNVAAKAEESLSRVESDPDQAQTEYTQLRTDYQNAVAEVKKVKPEVTLGEEGEAPGDLAASPGGAGPREVGEPPQPPSQSIEVPDLSSLLARLRRNDRLALLIVSVVSMLIGLQLLWVPKNDFGGLVDYISVFLWGFGLHELNKVALPAAASQISLPWFPATGTASGESQNQ